MKNVLITGFDAFGNTPINPAQETVKVIDGTIVDGAIIVARVVPSLFFKSIEVVKDAINDIEPEIVIMLGEYGGRSILTVERIAQNFNDSSRYKLTDNDGVVLQGRPTVSGGPAAYYTTLPIRAIVKAMREKGVPSDISDTPGTNICNHLMYGVLHHIAVNQLSIRAGWIHLPHLPSVAAMEQNLGAPSMSLETSVTGVLAGVQAAIEHTIDIDEPIISRWQI